MIHKALMYIGGFYLLTTLVSKGANSVEIGDVSISVLNTTALGITVEIGVPIINGLPVTATVNNLTANVFYGNSNVADINLYASTTINSGATTILVLETFISFTNLATQLVSIIQSGTYLAGLRVKGIVQVEGLNIPVNEPIHPI